MNCCSNCFNSQYLKEIIKSQNTLGGCEFCYSPNAFIYDANLLLDKFRGIFDLYVVDRKNGEALETQIHNDFTDKIFSKEVIPNVKTLIHEIISKDEQFYKKILSNKVILQIKKILPNQKKVQILETTWDNFANEIKHINRFHINNTINADLLKDLIKRYKINLPANQIYYRARIAVNNKSFRKKDMKNPPYNMASSGRANPEGISYLYLSKDIKTTFYESRATTHDKVFVGHFKSNVELNVINLDKNYDPIPFAEAQELEEYLIYAPFIKRLELELSKPKLRGDNDLDYLPTQYLSEFIKSIGFDGLEFKSTLHKNGINLAIFNPAKFECIKVTNYRINEIEFNETPSV